VGQRAEQGRVEGGRSGRGRRRRRTRRVVGAGLGDERGDARLAAEALLLELEEGAQLDEGGPTSARHVGNGVLEALVEAAEDVVDEVAVLDAMAEVPKGVSHLLEPRSVLNDGENCEIHQGDR
jgi:hypothetical protein